MKRRPPAPQCACATARQVARILTQLYDRQLEPAGIEAAQFGLLSALETLGPCTQARLGQHNALDKTTVSRNLKLLESKDWIKSTARDDKRYREIMLSPAGKKILANAKPAWHKTQTQLMSALPPGQWNAFFRALKNVATAARTLQDESGR
jgi:DNA-binding MarR family transcriptional regulator